MKKKLLTYILGLIVISIILGIILFSPLPSLIYPQFPLLGVFRRAVGILLLSAFLCLYRVLRGSTASDRIVSIDMLGILIIGFCAVLSISTRRNWYMDIGIAWALQSFISTLALAKFLEGKHFDE
ncbi:MAG TPA: multiple resistance and pH regulation protein F [Candidatus Omnitrophica bacterium]|nr:MAG: multiple resistance and pH regulation protein F [Candidatus Omnitrophota bacterium]RKY35721.1 MAG: multiple resistance and pH regulation protein F [Candidatus Omnitrophota bacterium]RKY44588.1 MAG: multiple resistance and pH regulation protein F [Candidatus Omnitrophota bacterium]HEC69972.1 multiple resistance and pH regulation protein F [Candidatus Omnitrophota bacterium]